MLCNASSSAGVRLSAEKVIYTPVSYYHIRTLTNWCILFAKMWMFIINTVHHPASTLIIYGKKSLCLNSLCTESTCSDTWSRFALKVLLFIAKKVAKG